MGVVSMAVQVHICRIGWGLNVINPKIDIIKLMKAFYVLINHAYWLTLPCKVEFFSLTESYKTH